MAAGENFHAKESAFSTHRAMNLTVRMPCQFSLLAAVLFFAVWTAYSTELVTHKEISVSRALAGHVLVWGTDEPTSGATVELCSTDWKTVFKSTRTDEKGHFSLEPPATGHEYPRASGAYPQARDLGTDNPSQRRHMIS